MARGEALLVAWREAEQLHVAATYSEELERELFVLCPETEKLRSDVARLRPQRD